MDTRSFGWLLDEWMDMLSPRRRSATTNQPIPFPNSADSFPHFRPVQNFHQTMGLYSFVLLPLRPPELSLNVRRMRDFHQNSFPMFCLSRNCQPVGRMCTNKPITKQVNQLMVTAAILLPKMGTNARKRAEGGGGRTNGWMGINKSERESEMEPIHH